MSCKCSQIGFMKKKKHKIGAGSETVLMEVLHGALPGAGMILSHEVKSMLPASVTDMMGDNAPYIIDGIGIIVGLGAPHLLDGEAKQYAKALGQGIAGQCIYSSYLRYRGQTAVAGRDNNAYSLAKAKQQQLRRHLRVAGRDNNAYALGEYQRPKGDGNGLYGGLPLGVHQSGYEAGAGRVSGGI